MELQVDEMLKMEEMRAFAYEAEIFKTQTRKSWYGIKFTIQRSLWECLMAACRKCLEKKAQERSLAP